MGRGLLLSHRRSKFPLIFHCLQAAILTPKFIGPGIAPALHTASPKNGAPLGLNAELDGNPMLTIDQATIDAIGQAGSHPPGVAGKVGWDCPWPGNNSVPLCKRRCFLDVL